LPLRTNRDVLGGALLVTAGLAMSFYAAQTYDLGAVRSMGPGMFPAAIGLILAIFGGLIAVPALFRYGDGPKIDGRPLFFVLSSVAAFAIAIRPFGLLPAVVASTLVSSFAGRRRHPRIVAALCLGLSAAAWIIFGLGLGLNVAMIDWPF